MSLDVYLTDEAPVLYSANITHNLGAMAKAAGIYAHLWRPEEIRISAASQLIVPLKEGLRQLEADPEKFKKLNPANGWGQYENLVEFVKEYIQACEINPGASVRVSR